MSDQGDKLVYLIRHGRAEDHHPLGDEARALTREGRREFRELAQQVGPGMALAGIACSPLVRAVQTAEILAQGGGIDRIEIHGELALAMSPGGLVRLARRLGPGWALVGHNPSMAEALAELLALPEPPRFRKGAIAGVSLAGPRAELAWVISPGRKKERSL